MSIDYRQYHVGTSKGGGTCVFSVASTSRLAMVHDTHTTVEFYCLDGDVDRADFLAWCRTVFVDADGDPRFRLTWDDGECHHEENGDRYEA